MGFFTASTLQSYQFDITTPMLSHVISSCYHAPSHVISLNPRNMTTLKSQPLRGAGSVVPRGGAHANSVTSGSLGAHGGSISRVSDGIQFGGGGGFQSGTMARDLKSLASFQKGGSAAAAAAAATAASSSADAVYAKKVYVSLFADGPTQVSIIVEENYPA